MNKQKMEKLHREVCRGKVIPADQWDDYMEYREMIAPSMDTFKPVATGKARENLKSGLLNELSKPAGIEYKQIANWWGANAG